MRGVRQCGFAQCRRRVQRGGGARGNSCVRQGHGVVIGAAEVCPRNILFVERIPDRPDRRRGYHVLRGRRRRAETVGQEARIGVVDHVVVAFGAIWFGPIGKRFEVADNRGDTRLREVRTIGEIVVGRVLVGGARDGIRIRDLAGRRHDRIAVAIAPESRIAGAQHEVVGPCAATEGLMEVVAETEAVGQRL